MINPNYGLSSPTSNYGGEEGGLTQGFAGDEQFNAFGAKSVRLAFIRKVYGILSAQLIITFGFVLVFALNEDTKAWAAKPANSGLILVAFMITMVSLFSLMCCGDMRKKFPHNFICLGIFTMAQSLSLGLITARYQTHIVVMAIAITAVVCVSLTIFAMQTKIDFTIYSGMAFVALIVLTLMGFMLMFIRLPMLQIVYSGVGALLFSFFLLIDTQMIMGGNRRDVLSPEEYILAVMMLYMDIINLFLHILSLLNSTK
jgi:FtsH-binding integral membrane protein